MFDSLLFLRGFAALMILMYHMQYPGVHLPTVFGFDLSILTFANGNAYVWIFFILSGYLIGKGFFTKRYILTPKSLGRFMTKRILRIVPAYYFIAILLTRFFGLWQYPDRWIILFKLLTFTSQGQILFFSIDYLWAISVEMQFYIIAPILYICIGWLQHKPQWMTLFWIIIIFIVGYIGRSISFIQYFPYWPGEYLVKYYSPLLYNLDFFIFGMSINLLLINKKQSIEIFSIKKRISTYGWIILSVCSLLLFYVISSYIRFKLIDYFPHYIRFHGIYLPIITMVMCGIYIYSSEQTTYRTWSRYSVKKIPIYQRILPHRVIEWIGSVSYEFYLVHLPLMNILVLHCLRDSNGCNASQFLLRFFLLTAISMFSAWLLNGFVQAITRAFRKVIV
jgi:peptidoglycan/LPS O-acetylase OafA/YrhL